jgi:ketol-acid reductoisomerase
MAQLNFGGSIENVVTREEFPLEKAQAVLKSNWLWRSRPRPST